MRNLIATLLALAVSQPMIACANGGYVAGGVVVGGPVGPRGGYYAPHWGYPGPRVGVYVGGPVVWGGWPWWGPPTYYTPAYPPVVAVPPPVVYVEKGDEAPIVVEQTPSEVLEPGFWYYCRERGAYYPTVKECPGRWQKVEPVRK